MSRTRDLAWRAVSREDLAALLTEARQLSSRAIGATTVYHLEHGGRELMAMALPDGHALVVERAPQARWRRRLDGESASPASR